MTEAPAFFVPTSAIDTPIDEEALYTGLAARCGLRPLSPDQRIYSVRYVHDGEEWTATVGETLHGIRRRTRGRGRQKTEYTVPVSDAAVVLAIFPGVPYIVMTNKGLKEGVYSAWENPFYAGQPKAVTYFSVPSGSSDS